MDRKRLCLTVPIGTSLKIGDDVVFVSHVVNSPALGRNGVKYNTAHFVVSNGQKFALIDNSEAHFRDYSIQATEITTTKVRLAVHASESIKIQRLGNEVNCD